MNFSSPQVSRLCDVLMPTLNGWVTSGMVRPSVADVEGRGRRRLWSWSDLLAVRVVAELRRAGVGVKQLRRVAARLQKLGHDEPLADRFLVLHGDDIVTVGEDRLVGALKRPGQHLLRQCVDLGRASQELGEAVKGL